MNCGTTIHKVYGNHVPCLHIGTAVQHTIITSGTLPFTGLNLVDWVIVAWVLVFGGLALWAVTGRK